MAVPGASRLRAVIGAPELAILLVSYGLFLYYFSATFAVQYFDEHHYLSLARLLADEGPLAQTELHAQRTYLYPLLLSGLVPLTGWNVAAIKTLTAMVQYAVLVGTVVYLAAAIDDADTPRPRLARAVVLVAGLWNPYLVQASALLLTDSLAACAVAFSLAAAWRWPLDRRSWVLATVAIASAGAMPRPAALPGLAMVVAALAFRLFWLPGERARSPLRFATLGVLGLLPLVPQLVLNVRNFGLWSVLPQIPMYTIQQHWAAYRLRWITSVDPRAPGGIAYLSPVPVGPDETIYSTLLENPLAFLVAYAAHWFHILDWGYVEIYVDDLYAPSRLVGSAFVYTAWALVVVGGVGLWRRLSADGDRRSEQGRWLVLGVAALAYAAFIATTQMETRYAYPVMLLAVSFAGPGAVSTLRWLRGGSHRLALAALGYVAAIGLLLTASLLLDRTSGRIDWFAYYFG